MLGENIGNSQRVLVSSGGETERAGQWIKQRKEKPGIVTAVDREKGICTVIFLGRWSSAERKQTVPIDHCRRRFEVSCRE